MKIYDQELRQSLDNGTEFRKYLYAAGYLITDDDSVPEKGYPFYDSWKSVKAGPYTFRIHPRQHLYLLDRKERTFFLIGHAYDPFSMTVREEEILEGFAACGNEREFCKKLNALTGIFVTGFIHEGRICFYGDAACMQTAFYGRVKEHFYISSHTQLLGELCGLERDPYIEKLIRFRWYRLFGIMFPGDMSPYKEIRHVIPNFRYCYDGEKVTHRRFWPVEEIGVCRSEEAYQEMIESCAGIMHSTMEAIALKWPGKRAAVSLTGGCDSKTTLSAANGLYESFGYFSYISQETERVDAEAASAICENLGLSHRTYSISERDEDFEDLPLIRKILACNTGNIAPQNANDVRKRVYFTRCHDFDVEVKSWVSEVARAYYQKRFAKRSFGRKASPRKLTAMYKVFGTERSLVRETDRQFERFLREYYGDDVFSKIDWTDLLFWEYRVSSWNGLVISNEHLLSFDITIPYNNRILLEKLLSAPLEKRLEDACHKDMQKILNPAIAGMGIHVINVKHTSGRARLERLYYEVQTRLPF